MDSVTLQWKNYEERTCINFIYENLFENQVNDMGYLDVFLQQKF